MSVATQMRKAKMTNWEKKSPYVFVFCPSPHWYTVKLVCAWGLWKSCNDDYISTVGCARIPCDQKWMDSVGLILVLKVGNLNIAAYQICIWLLIDCPWLIDQWFWTICEYNTVSRRTVQNFQWLIKCYFIWSFWGTQKNGEHKHVDVCPHTFVYIYVYISTMKSRSNIIFILIRLVMSGSQTALPSLRDTVSFWLCIQWADSSRAH